MVTTVCAAAAFALSGFVLVTSNGKNALAWAVVLIAFAMLWARIP